MVWRAQAQGWDPRWEARLVFNFGMREFFTAFGDTLALRGARSMRWLSRVGAWLSALFLPALVVVAIHSTAISWPDLFISQWPINVMFGGNGWIMLLAMEASVIPGVVSKQHGLPITGSGAPYRASARALTLALLGAARTGDETLAPLAPATKDAAAKAADAVEPEEIVSLASPLMDSVPRSVFDRALYVAGSLVTTGSLAYAGYVATTSVLPFAGRSTVADWGMFAVAGVWGLAGALVGCALVAWGNVGERYAQSVRLGFSAAVDADGVTSRYRGARGAVVEEVHIAWREVESLTQLKYTDVTLARRTVYALSSAHSLILWERPPDARYASSETRERIEKSGQAASRLLRAARTGSSAPLRDLSETFAALREDRPGLSQPLVRVASVKSAYTIALHEGDEELSRDLWRLLHPPKPHKSQVEPPFAKMQRQDRPYSSTTLRYLTFADRKRILGAMRALLPYLPADQEADPVVRDGRLDLSDPARSVNYVQRKGPFAKLELLAFCAWIGAFLLLPGPIAAASAWYSAPLERAAPATLTAETPSFIATLTTAQPGWLVKTPTSSNSTSAAFTPKGYMLVNGDEQPLVAPAPGVTMADGAAQVTVDLAPGGQDSYNSAGLLLEAPSGAAGVLFEIEAGSRWYLMSVQQSSGVWDRDFDLRADGDSSAISTNGPNTLLVIRRGQTYLLYINGQFVQAVHDDTARIASGGSVALYLDESAGGVRFTNLAIYPAPSNFPFWAR